MLLLSLEFGRFESCLQFHQSLDNVSLSGGLQPRGVDGNLNQSLDNVGCHGLQQLSFGLSASNWSSVPSEVPVPLNEKDHVGDDV